MQIAEDIIRSGMAAGNAFMSAITELIRFERLKNIIETGSYLGMGTTKAIRDGLSGGENVYSIEVNPEYHGHAKWNNRDSGIHFLLGLSVPKSMIPTDTTFNVPDFVVVDHRPEKRHELYCREVMHNVPDNRLYEALEAVSFKPDLVILDSAGHMGFIEFGYLMRWIPDGHSFYLALDDTLHVKHYDTMRVIKSYPGRFKVVFETDQKFGSAIIKVN